MVDETIILALAEQAHLFHFWNFKLTHYLLSACDESWLFRSSLQGPRRLAAR